ncbi:MAG TPA: UPF0158 family protein [Aggregatilineales bacterium]|nr:UPF0158 family protein [Aggregatilineales bacterium]
MNASNPKRQLPIDLAYLRLACETSPDHGQHYLDGETGEIILITSDVRRQFDYFAETLTTPEAHTPEGMDAAMSAQNIPYLLQNAFRDVARMTNPDADGRYILIPGTNPVGDIQDMSAFLDHVSDTEIQENLEACFAGGGTLSRYKAILSRDRMLLKAWLAFRDERITARAVKWLAGHGIIPT